MGIIPVSHLSHLKDAFVSVTIKVFSPNSNNNWTLTDLTKIQTDIAAVTSMPVPWIQAEENDQAHENLSLIRKSHWLVPIKMVEI